MNTLLTFKAADTKQLDDMMPALWQAMRGHSVFALTGDMGAGKTTLVNALMNHLGVGDESTGSPTFAIVNQYTLPTGDPVYHFDLYRLENEQEVIDTGFTDYIDSGALCLIEWPDRAAALLPDDTALIRITVDPLTNERTISLIEP